MQPKTARQNAAPVPVTFWKDNSETESGTGDEAGDRLCLGEQRVGVLGRAGLKNELQSQQPPTSQQHRYWVL